MMILKMTKCDVVAQRHLIVTGGGKLSDSNVRYINEAEAAPR